MPFCLCIHAEAGIEAGQPEVFQVHRLDKRYPVVR